MKLQLAHKVGLVVFPLILVTALVLPLYPSLAPYLMRPQLIHFYLTEPAMRDLMNLIAEDRIKAFPAIWDTSEGVLLSKKMYRPIVMDQGVGYGHLPYSEVLFFQTGTPDFQRKYAAMDSLHLRNILQRLETPFTAQATFEGNGFRRTGFDFNETCKETILFAGDSFTEGLWVEDREAFASLYAKSLNGKSEEKTCVVNSGTNGYGIFEESAVARDFYSKSRYRTLFLIVYPNDIASDGFRVVTGDLPGLGEAWDKYLSRLAQLAAFSRENQIRMILVPIPPKEQFAMPESRSRYQDKLAAFSQDHGIVFWDPFEFLSQHPWESLYFDWDPHFNPSGHRLFAAFLSEKTLTLPRAEL